MSVQTANGPINAENADNFEDIEKQFAVKGESFHCTESRLRLALTLFA